MGEFQNVAIKSWLY